MSSRTLFDMFLQVTSSHKDELAFLYKINGAQKQITYQQLFNDVLLLSNFFRDKGLEKGDKVTFISDNRYEWIVTDLALISIGAISVPRGTDTPTHELQYIISHSDSTYLIVETQNEYDKHLDMIESLNLKNTFILNDYSSLLGKNIAISSEDTNSFVNLYKLHKPEDIFTIIYTSGTTGKPKGVMLNHTNMLYNVEKVPKLIDLKQADVWLSILPPWHVFERGVEYVSLSQGCKMIYSSAKTFAIDLEYYQPTLVATVPRVWESMYSKINNSLAKEPAKAAIFNTLVSISKAYKHNQRVIQNRLPIFKKEPLFESLLKKSSALLKIVLLSPFYFIAKRKLSLVQKKFGGKLRFAISGGGSLPEYVDEWIDALGINILNSYGMTECSPSIAGRAKDCDIFGTVGAPLEGTELRVVDERSQEVKAGVVGEIQVKGPQVMQGYYNNPVANIQTFSADGFLRTGDLGKLTLSGELVLTGRAKEIIVLSNGENIDPTRIEAAISILPFINDAMLVGQDKKGLGLLIVADFEILKEFVYQKLNVAIESVEQLTTNKYLLNNLKKEFNAILHKDHGFKTFEKLQNIHFLEEEFKVGEELTNTLKKKRHIIEKKYQKLIDNFLK